MSVPTKGETFAKLLEHLRYAQEDAATLSHLSYANSENNLGLSWLQVSELLKKTQAQITRLATRGLQ